MKLLMNALAAGAVVLISNSAAALQQDPLEWKFKVFLDNRAIGFHEFIVSRDDDQTRVEIDARFNVKFLFLTAYKYQHKNAETWDANCLASINSATNDNGDRLTVAADRANNGYTIKDAEGATEVVEDACLMSFAYWNPNMLQATHLINSQTGAVEPVEVAAAGLDTVIFQGREIQARQYTLTVGNQTLKLWYGAEDYRWLALEADAEGGRLLRYEPLSLPDDVGRLALN